jgi:prepilin-type N-terminal cleavage/methylation domain-containing protein
MKVKEHTEREQGFTLIELLIAIVVVGVLTAVAIVGTGGLVDTGSVSACQASMDASKAASTLYLANTGNYPSSFTDLTGTSPKELDIPVGVTVGTTTLQNGASWTLTMTGGGTQANEYSCTTPTSTT